MNRGDAEDAEAGKREKRKSGFAFLCALCASAVKMDLKDTLKEKNRPNEFGPTALGVRAAGAYHGRCEFIRTVFVAEERPAWRIEMQPPRYQSRENYKKPLVSWRLGG
ncbi:MAG: hypothetical protein C4520_03490 [Candidatus Abyssobacteria bacterium SURF_5]|uniref:Uncharacterized protein n=1 Tax=Abyssobacteria bacterium (strain SURF_5) TaxID=2093360 RepID=A0A3A4P2V2_ABYX5|nr:MAG: hypothetical protein C4520_03490 [Candidatus Abyssubacteria bacterium SURF_5]